MPVSKHQQIAQGFASSAARALDQVWDRAPGALSVADRRAAERARMRRERAERAAAEGEAIVQRREQAMAAEEAAARAPEALEERLREQLHAVIRSVWS